MRYVSATVLMAGSLGLAACAVAPPPPTGPSFAAMPGPGKTFDQFQADNARCMQAGQQASGPLSPAQAANQSAVGSAVAGTALGAATGALIGAAAGGPAVGAAIGAGTGLLAGSAIGANTAQASAGNIQRAYDIAYAQCMAASGDKVPEGGAGYPAGAYPGGAYPAAAYPAGAYPAYGYPYPYAGYYPYYGYYGAPFAVGWGWGGWGWGGGWHGGWGGGWHGGGYWHH